MWKVIINGADVGIIETNYAWAKRWWEARAARLNYTVKLRYIPNENPLDQ